MKGLLVFGEQFFWTILWLLLTLTVAVFLLSWLKQQTGIFGQVGGWTLQHAGLNAEM